jgi:hypothetical protein
MPRHPKLTPEQIADLIAEIKDLKEQVAELKSQKTPPTAAPQPAPAPQVAKAQNRTGIYKDATPEKMKELLKENWASKKEQYNAAKRAKRAAVKGKAPTLEIKEAEEAPAPAPAPAPVMEAPKNEIIQAAPKKQRKNAKQPPKPKAEAVPTEPPRLRQIFGDSVACPDDETTWVAHHTKKWEQLSETSQTQYASNARKALINAGYAPPKTSDPIVIADYAGSVPIDIWKVVSEATDPKYSVDTRNNFSKGLLGVFNAKIRKLIEAKQDTHRLCVWSTISQLMNSNAKKDTGDKHQEQGQSVVAEKNTAEWGDWETKAKEYISKADKSFTAQRDAAIVAVYTLIPPVRRNWFNVEVVKEAPTKDDKRNSLHITAEGATMYWGNFKNKASFKNELPLRLPVENAELVALLRKYTATLKNKWLFPSSDRQNAKPFSRDAFGSRLGDLTQKIVGKRFTCNRMRASFITWWHDNNSKNGVNVSAMRSVMRQLHQTNFGINLSYAKLNAKWNKAVQQIKGDATKADA